MILKKWIVGPVFAMSIGMALPASATVVALYGGTDTNASIFAFLKSQGYSTVGLSRLSEATLSGVDSVLLLRVQGNQALTNFVQNGGKVITEWSGAEYGMTLFGGKASDQGFSRTNPVVSFDQAGIDLGLSNGIGGSYADSRATEHFYNLTLGNATSYATRPDGRSAIAGGAVGSGFVFVNAYNWADSFGKPGSNSGQLLLNELSSNETSRPVAKVSEPSSLVLLGLGMFGMIRRKRVRN